MAFAKISQVAHYAPAQVVTNDDLSKIMDTSDEWIRSRTGIQERRISLNENTSDLATNVAYQLLEKSGLSTEELDFVLVQCRQWQHVFKEQLEQLMPSLLILLRHAVVLSLLWQPQKN